MGKKTTPAKDRKVKPATRSSKKPGRVKGTSAPRKTDNKKTVEKVLKTKQKSVAVPKTAERPSSPKTATARSTEKSGVTPPSDAAKTVAKQAGERSKGNNTTLVTSKSNAKIASAPRAPREIGGLPKIPATRGIFDRVPKNERRPAREVDSGGNGDDPDVVPSGEVARTYLNDDELREFRDLLLTKRQEIIRDVTNLEDEAIRQASSGATTSTMPIHMADLGTDTWEQELTLGLIENERSLLREIDEALERVDNKTYGMCVATNKRISKARLQAKPWAKHCIEYARKRELGLA